MAKKTVAEKLADAKEETFRPSRLLTEETKLAKAEAAEDRQSRALADTFIPKESYGFEEQEKIWANADLRKRKAMLFYMVLKAGFVMGRRNTIQRIQRYFGLTAKEWESDPHKDEYIRVMWMADEARVSMIDENVFIGFLINDRDAGGKYHIQNTYAYKVQNPAWEGVETVNQAPSQIIYNEVKGANTELRDELEQLVKRREAEAAKKMN